MRSLLIILLIACGITNASAEDTAGKLKIGQMVPEELGIDLDGNKVNTRDHIGKVMVISFWATWCPPCRKELPIIDNLQRLAGKEHLSVFAVNLGESKRVYKKFINAAGDANLTFTHDNKGRIGRKIYGIKGIPHMVIVDHEGKIAHIHSGYGDETVNNLVNEINALFRKQSSGA